MVLTLGAIRWLCVGEPCPSGAVARPHDRNAVCGFFGPARARFDDAGQAAQCPH